MNDDYRHRFCEHIDKAIGILNLRCLRLDGEIGGRTYDAATQAIREKIACRRAVYDAIGTLGRVREDFTPTN